MNKKIIFLFLIFMSSSIQNLLIAAVERSTQDLKKSAREERNKLYRRRNKIGKVKLLKPVPLSVEEIIALLADWRDPFTVVNLSETEADDKVLSFLCGMTSDGKNRSANIRTLKASHTDVDGKGIQAFCLVARSLTKLELIGCKKIKHPRFVSASLLHLVFSYTEIIDVDIETVVAGCPALEILDLTGCRSIQNPNIAHENLRELYLHDTSVTDAALVRICTQCPNLTVLGIRHSVVTDECVAQLRLSYPGLTIITR
jgi:hypothetical protein